MISHYARPLCTGKYETKGAIGNQPDSKKENQARTVFGTSTRDQSVKLGCEEELLKTIAFGRASPGPCTYTAASGHGKQVGWSGRWSFLGHPLNAIPWLGGGSKSGPLVHGMIGSLTHDPAVCRSHSCRFLHCSSPGSLIPSHFPPG